MNDIPDPNKKPEEQESETPAASVAGKGWEILVGGKENPYAAGGSDPFDQSRAAASKSADMAAKDAETDAILGVSGAPTSSLITPPSPSAATPVASGIMEINKPPGAGSIIEVNQPAQPAPAPMPAGPTQAASSGITEVGASPSASSIIEISKPESPAPASAPLPRPMMPASGGIMEVGAPSAPMPATFPPAMAQPGMPSAGVMPSPSGVVTPAPRPIPAARPAAPVPVVPGQGIAPGQRPSTGSMVSDPFSTQSDVPLGFDNIDRPPDPELEKMLIVPERINRLWNEIDETYNMVINDVRGHYNTTETAILQLREARELLLAGEENFDNAEALVARVKARLRLEEKVRQWIRGRGAWLVFYLVLWFGLLSLATFFTTQFDTIAIKFVPEFLVGTWLPTLFGAMGGTIGALWVFIKHVTKKRDFDPVHTMWYITNPILGGALGVATYIIVQGSGGVLTLAGGGQNFNLSSPESTPAAWLLYALCLVVGFNQNVLWSLVDRFIKAVVPEKEEDKVAATDMSTDTKAPPSPVSTPDGIGGGSKPSSSG